MDVRISVIVPTIGRASVAQAVESCAGAHEVLLVVDRARAVAFDYEPPSTHVRVLEVEGGDHGYTARAAGMAAATGTHLAFLDDDDEYVPGALDVMREAANERPCIFRMAHLEHGVLWRTPDLRFGNVGTPMFLVPNDPSALGTWQAHDERFAEPGGDYTFISQCCERMGDPVWREEVVALVQPPGRANEYTVAVVTPWLDHPELVYDYTVAVQVGRPDEVLVVDDASNPPLEFAALRNARNLGFSRSCNNGLQAATSDVVVFLNNDIAMGKMDWLEVIREAVEPGVLVGPLLRYDKHGDVDGEQYPYLDGWCIAGMREDLLALGGLDTSYTEPAYYSDNDLCLRARAEGMSLREVRIGLQHKLGATNGTADSPAKVAACEANYKRYAEQVRQLVGAAP